MIEKSVALPHQLNLSCILKLPPLNDINKINYYIDVTFLNNLDRIICKKNNEYVIDYCSDTRIISREYKLV